MAAQRQSPMSLYPNIKKDNALQAKTKVNSERLEEERYLNKISQELQGFKSIYISGAQPTKRDKFMKLEGVGQHIRKKSDPFTLA
jgi:hypothetical protein